MARTETEFNWDNPLFRAATYIPKKVGGAVGGAARSYAEMVENSPTEGFWTDMALRLGLTRPVGETSSAFPDDAGPSLGGMPILPDYFYDTPLYPESEFATGKGEPKAERRGGRGFSSSASVGGNLSLPPIPQSQLVGGFTQPTMPEMIKPEKKGLLTPEQRKGLLLASLIRAGAGLAAGGLGGAVNQFAQGMGTGAKTLVEANLETQEREEKQRQAENDLLMRRYDAEAKASAPIGSIESGVAGNQYATQPYLYNRKGEVSPIGQARYPATIASALSKSMSKYTSGGGDDKWDASVMKYFDTLVEDYNAKLPPAGTNPAENRAGQEAIEKIRKEAIKIVNTDPQLMKLAPSAAVVMAWDKAAREYSQSRKGHKSVFKPSVGGFGNLNQFAKPAD